MNGLSDDDRWVIALNSPEVKVKHWLNPEETDRALCGREGRWEPAWLYTAGHRARECVKCSQALTRMGR